MAEKYPRSQTDDQNSEKPQCSPNILVAAIDFGTAYSGYAYSSRVDFDNDPLNIKAHKWSQSLISHKTPTCALFNKNKELIAFGYEAEKRFTELTEENKHQDYYYFQRFKMNLFSEKEDRRKKKLSKESMIRDIKGDEMPAIDVFSAAIKYMKDCLLKELKEQNDENAEKAESIRWVLTVPAIWDDSAKQFMRIAAEKAEIRSGCLTIAFEPEAASMYCKGIPLVWLTGKSVGFEIFRPGNQYLILDAGGGTVDIAIHKVLENKCVKELHKASGGAWGGTYVDDKFFEILEEIIGKNELEKYKIECLSDYIELRQNLEIKKRDISTTSTKVSFIIPPQLKQRCKSSKECSFEELISKSKFAGVLRCKRDKLEFKESLIKEWFSTVCDSIVKHVTGLLEKHNIETILMVGGFSESPFLHETMVKYFSNIPIVVPDEAGLAVLKGAVLFGHNPQVIVSRVAKVTYGVNTLSKIQDKRDVPNNRIVVIKGVEYAKDVFSKHVTKGDELVLDEAQEEKTYFPIYPEQKSVQFNVYTSPKENPKYVDEEGCRKLGNFTVDIPDTTDGTERKVHVKFIFGGTEIKVEAVDEKTNKVTECTFEWSENSEEECYGMAVEMNESQ